MQTDLEAYYAITSHQRPQRVLYRTDFTPDLKQRVIDHIGTDDIDGHYGIFRKIEPYPKMPEVNKAEVYGRYYHGETLSKKDTYNDLGVANRPGSMYHFCEIVSPLRKAESLADIENYPLPDPNKYDWSTVPQRIEAAHAAGKVAAGLVGHIYENSWQIRGYQQFLMDMISQPAWAECIFDRVAAYIRALAVNYTRAGVDELIFGDDVANQNAMMFAPEMWRNMIHRRWLKIWGEVKEINPDCRIWYHSDGNISDVVGELVEGGINLLNPLQPECLNVDDIYARYGSRITFDGCIGTQTTMPFGTPKEVRARVREIIDKYGRDGGLIISPTHILEPDVPIENIDAFFDACREYGTFE